MTGDARGATRYVVCMRIGGPARKHDIADADLEHTDDLRDVAEAADAVTADQARLQEAVAVARARGRSWNHIALALGVSRQAARQRFTDHAA